MKISTNGTWRARLVRALTLGLLWQVPQLAAAQITPTATWQWATRATSTAATDDFSEGNFIKVDGTGNTFSAGTFHGTLTLGSTSLAAPGDYDSFLAKYTPAGAVAWVRHLNGSSQETVVYGLATDNSGNSYVSGYYHGGTMVIGTTTLTGGGGFVVKYDPQGTVLWARAAGHSFNGLACTATGELVAMGNFSGSVVFGNTTLTTPAFSNSSFLVKYDAQANALWAAQMHGISNDEGMVSLDPTGNIYFAADFTGTATFGPVVLPGNVGDNDTFVAKYSAAGMPLWAVRQPIAGAAGREHAWALAVDAAGYAYLTGSSESTTSSAQRWFVTQYTPQGAVGWNHLSNTISDSGLTGVATDATGNVYVTGGVAGSLSIGGLSLVSSGSNDLNLALLSFSPQGAPRWALSAGSTTGTESGLALALDNANNLYLTGVLQGNTTLGSLSIPQNSTAGEQFVAKVSISAITATQQARAAGPLQLYTNPARGSEVTVRWPGLNATPSQLLVHDALGRCVLTQALIAGHTDAVLAVDKLKSGIYTLQLKTATATAVGRLVVE